MKFFKNINGLLFVPITLNIGTTDYRSKQINWVDFDNDGDSDLFLTSNTNGNSLFENTGNLIFQDITSAAGLPITNLNTFSASWGDYNNDGFLDGDNDADLDLYVSGTDVNTPNHISAAFYENIRPNNFQIPSNAGFQDDDRFSYSNAIGDLNNDGLVDFVVTNSNDQNVFYLEK